MIAGGQSSGALLLDTLAVQPVAAYSLRKLRTAYAGSAIRVRRSSDNAEADIGFVGGVLDTASLLTHCGAGDGFVVTWYGQNTGAQINVTQATAADQPQIVATGAVLLTAGRPAIRTNGDWLRSAAVPSLAAGPLTLNGVTRVVGFFGSYRAWWALGAGNTAGQSIDVGQGGSGTDYYVGGAAVPSVGVGLTLVVDTPYIATQDHSGSAASAWLNGTENTDNITYNYTGATGEITVGNNRALTASADTVTAEFMAFAGAVLSAGNRAVLQSNQSGFYGITVA